MTDQFVKTIFYSFLFWILFFTFLKKCHCIWILLRNLHDNWLLTEMFKKKLLLFNRRLILEYDFLLYKVFYKVFHKESRQNFNQLLVAKENHRFQFTFSVILVINNWNNYYFLVLFSLIFSSVEKKSHFERKTKCSVPHPHLFYRMS